MNLLTERLVSPVVRRRLIATGITCIIAAGCAIAVSPIVGALRYDSLVTEHQSTRGQMKVAVESVVAAQDDFNAAAESSLPAYSDISAFLGVVTPDLLADSAALDELMTVRSDLQKSAGMFERSHQPGVKLVFDAAPAPRLPGETDPTTVEGLIYAIDRNHGVVAQYTDAADRFRAQAVTVRDGVSRSNQLIENVLASAAKYGSSRHVLKYSKADVTVKVRLNGAIGDLDDTAIDPVARYTAFADAVLELRTSHAAAVAEEERLEREKQQEAERAAAEEAKRLAEEEEALRAAEEAEREAEKERNGPQPTPTPTPGADQAPAPTPVPGADD